MQKIKIDNKVYNVKDNYNEITISDYLQINDILSSKVLDEIDKVIGIITIISDIEEDTLLKINYKDFKYIESLISFLLIELPQSLNMKKEYIINNQLYIVNYNMNDMNVSQFIDMQHLSTEDYIQNMHKILSLFFIPAVKTKNIIFGNKYQKLKYNIDYKVEDISIELLNHLSIVDAYPLMLFFCKNLENLTAETKKMLMIQLVKLMGWKKRWKYMKELMNIIKSGDGSQQLENLQNLLTKVGNRSIK